MRAFALAALAACGGGSSAAKMPDAVSTDVAPDTTSDAPVATISGLHASGNKTPKDPNGTFYKAHLLLEAP